jgi:hypothetical protein
LTCPNCKTELVEVNGRYICTDCGREIPENEVMAGDWGNSGMARDGLYGAGTDAIPDDQSKSSASDDDQTEEVGTTDQTEVTAGEASVGPLSNVDLTESITPSPEGVNVSPQADITQSSTTAVLDTGLPVSDVATDSNLTPQNVIPASGTSSETPTEAVVTPDIPTELPKPEEVKDMFDSTEPVPSQPTGDPGIYTDPLYENSQTTAPEFKSFVPTEVSTPTKKSINWVTLLAGFFILFLLIGGGTWGYFALTGGEKPIIQTPGTVTWQELKVSKGGFKIDFPGEPEILNDVRNISGTETKFENYIRVNDDDIYSVRYAALESAQAKKFIDNPKTELPLLVNEIATTFEGTVSDTKVGKFDVIDAIDFTLTSATAKYQGKLLITGKSYILIMAGGINGGAADYDKYIKSFAFITPESNN